MKRLLTMGADHRAELKGYHTPSGLGFRSMPLGASICGKASLATKYLLIDRHNEDPEMTIKEETGVKLVTEALRLGDFAYVKKMRKFLEKFPQHQRYCCAHEKFGNKGPIRALEFAIMARSDDVSPDERVRIVRFLVLVLGINLNNFSGYNWRVVPHGAMRHILKNEGYAEMITALLEMGARLYYYSNHVADTLSPYRRVTRKPLEVYKPLLKGHPRHPRDLMRSCFSPRLVPLETHEALLKKYFPEEVNQIQKAVLVEGGDPESDKY